LDHAPITVKIPIIEEHIQTKKCSLIKDSEEKVLFIKELIHSITNINTSQILCVNDLEATVQRFAYDHENLWFKYFKSVNITKCSKVW